MKLLADRGALLGHHEYKHTYPHCWRCHNPVIFRATEQWFIKMDAVAQGAAEIAARRPPSMKSSTSNGSPPWGEERMYEMIAEASRLVRLSPAFLGRAHHRFLLRRLAARASKISPRCAMSWSGSKKKAPTPGSSTLRKNYCPPAPSVLAAPTKWRKENDILDVWFDSGSSNLAVLHGAEWPADVYLEGPDQYRGWFHSSLLVAHRHPQQSRPFNGVVTHGWTLDEQGRPMSKSLGNVIRIPPKFANSWGADLLRLWVASA